MLGPAGPTTAAGNPGGTRDGLGVQAVEESMQNGWPAGEGIRSGHVRLAGAPSAVQWEVVALAVLEATEDGETFYACMHACGN